MSSQYSNDFHSFLCLHNVLTIPTASCVLTILWQCSHIFVSWLYSYFVHIFLCPHCALCSHLPVSSLCPVFTSSCVLTVLCVHIFLCAHCTLCSHLLVSSLCSVFTSSCVLIVLCIHIFPCFNCVLCSQLCTHYALTVFTSPFFICPHCALTVFRHLTVYSLRFNSVQSSTCVIVFRYPPV